MNQDSSVQPGINLHVLCDKCGKIMRLSEAQWINGIVFIEAEACSCVYDRKMKKFNKKLDKLI